MNLDLASCLLAGCASLLVGFSKTGVPGVSILVVVIMAEVLGAKSSVGAILPMLLLGDCFAVAFFRRHAQWDRLWRLFPYVVAGGIPGQIILCSYDNALIRPLLGFLVLGLLTVEVARQWFGWEKMPHQWWFTAIMGFLAGFATTVGNAAGPIMSIYLVSMGLPKDKFMGTTAWFYMLVNLAKLPAVCWWGLISVDSLRLDAVAVPLIVLGAVAGLRVLAVIRQQIFDALALILAGVTAIHLVLH
jgi:uncharacterized protein